MTAKRMISGDVLKYRNGFFIPRRYETCFRRSSNFALTLPRELLRRLFAAATELIETAHNASVAGQSGEIGADDYAAVARRLQAAAQDIAALAEAARVITAERLDDAGFDHIENSS